MVKKINKRHYLASPGTGSLGYVKPYRGYSTDGEESQRSDYRTARKHRRSRSAQDRAAAHYTDGEASSDIYITSGAYRAPSEYSRGSRQSRAPSHYSYRSRPGSVASGTTIRTKVDKKRGMVVETMSAPNPFCPNTKGLCCLMLLLNLALILITLGFVIVIQFFEPFFVWILGIVFLVFGFVTLIGSLIYCVTVCRDAKTPEEVARSPHYWTHHWQKTIGAPPEIHYAPEYLTDTDHYSVSEKQGRRSSRY